MPNTVGNSPTTLKGLSAFGWGALVAISGILATWFIGAAVNDALWGHQQDSGDIYPLWVTLVFGACWLCGMLGSLAAGFLVNEKIKEGYRNNPSSTNGVGTALGSTAGVIIGSGLVIAGLFFLMVYAIIAAVGYIVLGLFGLALIAGVRN